MSAAKEGRDVGLAIHRILQWIATVSSALIVAFLLSGIDTWEKLKEQSIRMEDVPVKVDKILDKVEDIDRTVDRHGIQIEQLQTKRR